MKKTMKVIVIAIFIIIISSNNAFASSIISDIFTTGEDWTNIGQNRGGIGINESDLISGSNDIYNLFLAVATAVAVIVGALLGVRYMTAGIDEKVKVKESLFPYLISCVVVFGAMGIWRLVVALMKNLL